MKTTRKKSYNVVYEGTNISLNTMPLMSYEAATLYIKNNFSNFGKPCNNFEIKEIN